jgi:chromosome condensin MukBEF MukE localization factor
MVSVPCSGQIDDFLKRALLKLLPYSLLSSQKKRQKHIVQEALVNHAWTLDIQGALNWNHYRLYSGLGHLN